MNNLEQFSKSYLEFIEFVNGVLSENDNLKKQIIDYEKRLEKYDKENHSLKYDLEESKIGYKFIHEKYDELKNNIVLTKDKINREGRPSKMSKKDKELIIELRSNGTSQQKIGELLDVSQSTISNILKENKGSIENNCEESSIHLNCIKETHFFS